MVRIILVFGGRHIEVSELNVKSAGHVTQPLRLSSKHVAHVVSHFTQYAVCEVDTLVHGLGQVSDYKR